MTKPMKDWVVTVGISMRSGTPLTSLDIHAEFTQRNVIGSFEHEHIATVEDKDPDMAKRKAVRAAKMAAYSYRAAGGQVFVECPEGCKPQAVLKREAEMRLWLQERQGGVCV